MLTIRPARTLRGKFDLPSDYDLLFLSIVISLARKQPLRITPVAETPLLLQWRKLFEGHALFSIDNSSLVITPVTNDPSILIGFEDSDLPWRDLTFFTLVGMGKTVAFRSISNQRVGFWIEQAKRIGCQLVPTDSPLGTCLSILGDSKLPGSDTVINDIDHDALCGFLLGASLQHSFVSETILLSPVRTVAPSFNYAIEVKNAIPKERDSIERRMQLLQGKSDRSSGQLFRITANFTKPGEFSCETVEVTLPGDAVLGAAFTAAKCLFPKSSFTINNFPLETWATPFLPFLRKAGGKIAAQETGRTSFGSTGMVTVQLGELVGKRLDCSPAFRYFPSLPSMTVMAAFSKGESVFRGLADLRNDSVDRIALVESCIRSLGARHGEMPDGIVMQGGSGFDGFDIMTPIPVCIATAFSVAATRCVGDSKINDTSLNERYPQFRQYLETFFEYRDSHANN